MRDRITCVAKKIARIGWELEGRLGRSSSPRLECPGNAVCTLLEACVVR